MMYATTRDFVTFTEPQIWQDGLSRIDSTVTKVDGTYYRFTKDEGAGTTGCSDIIQESSTVLTAPLEDWDLRDGLHRPATRAQAPSRGRRSSTRTLAT